MTLQAVFSAADLERVRAAVVEAEAQHAGEIVPYLVGRIDRYDVAHWRGATLGAMLAALIAGVLHSAGNFWWSASLWWITLPALTGAVAGYAFAFLPAIRRFLLLPSDIDPLVRRRAEAAFLEEEVFQTRRRTGVLIFLALFERRAVILADSGITRVVAPELWQTLVDDLVLGIRQGRAATALCDAIARCGEVLRAHEIDAEAEAHDEVHNRLRIREH